MPATAGGRTIGSSTSVIASDRPGKRRVARTYAVGVPNSRISDLRDERRLEVTMSAS